MIIAVGQQISFVEADPIEYLSKGASDLTFDFIVFGYSIWYFSSQDILSRLLHESRTCAQTVLIAEHGLSAPRPAQVPHLLAALTDNALESFRGEESKRNIRCALTPGQIKKLAADAGWALAKEEMATPSPKQIDAKMEVRMVLKSRMFRGDLDEVISRTDPKKGIMLQGMIDAVAASVQNLEGGWDDVVNMDIWLARFEKSA
ncbi:putative sam-dependent methyltransferase [Diaporthe ampelina]|uniref:Putative sam-dependent methyltransferase n=1 Tax=Diaporthe ampelina TaxID=1214573 RepID=A0A0G2FRY2_9PEZI|nr:putative sam-dependent methyltransferase [Diaporthe ampelina]